MKLGYKADVYTILVEETYVKDLDAAIESLGFQLSPLEAFVDAELAKTTIGGEAIVKTQEQVHTGAMTSRAMNSKWVDQQTSDFRHQIEDAEVLKYLAGPAEPSSDLGVIEGTDAREHTSVQSSTRRQGRLAEPAPSPITAAPWVPNRGESSWGQRQNNCAGEELDERRIHLHASPTKVESTRETSLRPY